MNKADSLITTIWSLTAMSVSLLTLKTKNFYLIYEDIESHYTHLCGFFWHAILSKVGGFFDNFQKSLLQ
jgi:hypothetical protein